MEALIGLGLLVGGAALMNGDVEEPGPNAFDVKKMSDLNSEAEQTARDIRDAGDVYFMQSRPFQSAYSQIQYNSEWYIPWGNPTQTPTYDLNKVIESRAVNTALIESQAPKYNFTARDCLGMSYGAGQKNNGYNIGIPYPETSFRWDPGNSLAYCGKVFIDRYRDSPVGPYTNRYKTAGGEPTMDLREELPDEADVPIKSRNPYGPYGYYQSIYRNRNYEKQKLDGNKPIRPHTLHNVRYKKPWQVRFEPQPSEVYK